MRRNNIPVNNIARELNISPATVSRVLNHPELVKEKTKNMVLESIKNSGYAQQNKTETSDKVSTKNLIMVVIPSIGNPFYNRILKGIKASALSKKHEVLLYNGSVTSETLDNFLDVVKSIGAKGVIYLSYRMPVEVIDTLDKKINIVQCCEYNHESKALYVSIDDFSAAKSATDYIITMNYSKIAFINGPLTFNYAQERLRGFETSCREAGITTPSSWKISLPNVEYDVGYSAACQLLGDSSNRPDAIFCASDVFAVSVIKAAHRFNLRIPEDLGIVGFDNIDIASIATPGITTINQPGFQIGFSAAEVLFTKINNPEAKPKSIFLDTEMVTRDSIFPLKKEN